LEDDVEIEYESSQDFDDEDSNVEADTIPAEGNNNEPGEEGDIEALISIEIKLSTTRDLLIIHHLKYFSHMVPKHPAACSCLSAQ
jgi:hypothetical protein